MSGQQNSAEDCQARKLAKVQKRLLTTASKKLIRMTRQLGKVPRNAPCPCGSGRKYKHCHGKL